MAGELSGKRVAILAADGVERVELEQPRQAVRDAGADVDLLSIHDGEIAARNNDLKDAGTFNAFDLRPPEALPKLCPARMWVLRGVPTLLVWLSVPSQPPGRPRTRVGCFAPSRRRRATSRCCSSQTPSLSWRCGGATAGRRASAVRPPR
jgi:hypothetical protein